MDSFIVIGNGYNHIGVTGATAIDHRVRHKLKITCDEYVVLDFLFQCRFDKMPPNKVNRDKEIGFDVKTFMSCIASLTEKRIIDANQEPNIEVKSLFDYDEHFEKIWIILKTNNGNKKAGMKMWKKAVKVASVNTLLQCARNYADFKDGAEPQYWMHVSSFLNPEYSKFNDYLTKPKFKSKTNDNERSAEWKS